MRKLARRVVLWGLVLLVVVSVLSWPTKSAHAGDPWLEGAEIDPAVMALLRRSCGDCHSEDTHYLWYSYVAPASLLVNSDVDGGRRHLNFSQWSDYPLARQERLLSEIANQVKDRDMPLVQYLWIHKEAKLTDADIHAIFQWTQAERARLIASGGGASH